jgi:hypothetical protein
VSWDYIDYFHTDKKQIKSIFWENGKNYSAICFEAIGKQANNG